MRKLFKRKPAAKSLLYNNINKLSSILIVVLLISASSSVITSAIPFNSEESNNINVDFSEDTSEEDKNEEANDESENSKQITTSNDESILSKLKLSLYNLLIKLLDRFPRLANLTFFQNLLNWLNDSHDSDEPTEDILPPTQVIGLSVEDFHDGKLSLTWDAASDNVGVDHYRVYRDGIFVVDVSATEYLDTGLVDGDSYDYQVCAVDAAGNVGENSSIVSGTPTETVVDNIPPTQVTGLSVVDARDGKLDLSWDAATDNVGVDYYKIYRNGSFIIDVSGLNYQDSGLTNDVSYTYQVSAVDTSDNEGQKSLEESGTPTESPGGDTQPPSQVIGLSVEDFHDGKLSLTWDAASDNVGVDHYRVYRDGIFVVDVSATEYLDTGLVDGDSYDYQVCAVDAAGNVGENSSIVSGTPTEEEPEDTQPPTKVTGLNVEDAHDGQLYLSWNAATDNVGVDHYIIYRDGNPIDEVDITEYLDTGLTNDVSYTYQISAVDTSDNEGLKSDSVSKTPTESSGDATIVPESGHIAIGGNGYIVINTTLDIDGVLVTLIGTIYLQTGTESLHIWWNLTTGYLKINATSFTHDGTQEFSLVDFYLKIEDPNTTPNNIIIFDFNHFSIDGPGALILNHQGEQGNIILCGNLKVGEINGQINLNNFQNATIQGTFYSGKYKEITGEANIEWDLTGDTPYVYVSGNMTRDSQRQINIDDLIFDIENTISISADKINFTSDSHIEIGDGYIDISDAFRSITLENLLINFQGTQILLNGCLEITSGRNTTIIFGQDYINISFANGMTSIDLSDFYLDVNNGQFTVGISHLTLIAENELWISFGEELKVSASVDSLVLTECSISPTSDLYFMVNGSFDLSNADNGFELDFTSLEDFEVDISIEGSVILSDVVFMYDDNAANKHVSLSWDSLDISAGGSANIKVFDGELTVDGSGTVTIVLTGFLFYYSSINTPPAWSAGYMYTDISFGIPSFSITLSADVQDFSIALPGSNSDDGGSGGGSGGGGSGGSGGSSGSSLFVNLEGDFQLSGDLQVNIKTGSYNSFNVNAAGNGEFIIGDFYLYLRDSEGEDIIPFINEILVEIDYIQIIGGGGIDLTSGEVLLGGTIWLNELYIDADTTILNAQFECDFASTTISAGINIFSGSVSVGVGTLELSEFSFTSDGFYLGADLISLNGPVVITLGATISVSAGGSYLEIENLLADIPGAIHVELDGIFNLDGSSLDIQTDMQFQNIDIVFSGDASIDSFDLYLEAPAAQVSLDWDSITATGSGNLEIQGKKVTVDASFDMIDIIGLDASFDATLMGISLTGSISANAELSLDISPDWKIRINGTGTISSLNFEAAGFGKVTCSFIELYGDLKIDFAAKQLNIVDIDVDAIDLTMELGGSEIFKDVTAAIEGDLLMTWDGTLENINSVYLEGDFSLSLGSSIPIKIGVLEIEGSIGLDGEVYLESLKPGWSIDATGFQLSGKISLISSDFKLVSLSGVITIDGYGAFKKLSDRIEISLTGFSVTANLEIYIACFKTFSSEGSITGSGDITVGLSSNGYIETSSGFTISGSGISIGSLYIQTSLVLSAGSYIGWSNLQGDTKTFTFEDFNAELDIDINNVRLEVGSITATEYTVITLSQSESYMKVNGGFNFDVFRVSQNGETLFEALSLTISDVKIKNYKNNPSRTGIQFEKINDKTPAISIPDGSFTLFGKTYDYIDLEGHLRGSVTVYLESSGGINVFHVDGSSDASVSINVGTSNYHISVDVGFSTGGGQLNAEADLNSNIRYIENTVSGFNYYSIEGVLNGCGLKLQNGATSGTFRIEWEQGLKNISVVNGLELVPSFVYFTKSSVESWIQLWPIGTGEMQAFIEGPQWANAGEEVCFHGAAIGGDGDYTFEWDFNGETDDGFQKDDEGRNVCHTYPKNEGTCIHHQVILKVTDSSGNEVTADHHINITSLKAHPGSGVGVVGVCEDLVLSGYSEEGCYENNPSAQTKYTWALYPMNDNGKEFNKEFTETEQQTIPGGLVRPGEYIAEFTVSIFIGDELKEQDSERLDGFITISGATIDAEETNVNIGETVNFIVNTYGSCNSFTIDYGDGTSGGVTHEYDDPGVYTATINYGCESEFNSIVITVHSFSVDAGGPYDNNSQAYKVGDEIQFHGSIKDYDGEGIPSISWDFGDGETCNNCGLNPVHIYESTPPSDEDGYKVTLTVTIGGETNSDTDIVFVEEIDYEPPSILSVAAGGPGNSCGEARPNERINVYVHAARSTYEPSHYWYKLAGWNDWRSIKPSDTNVWDSKPIHISNPEPGKVTGSYILFVKIEDSEGYESNSWPVNLRWTRLDTNILGPKCAFDICSLPFRATGSDPPCFDFEDLAHSWTFGDGGGASGQYVSHKYADDGVYFVKLTSAGWGDIYDTAYQSIRVLNVPPYSNFSVNPLVKAVDEQISFDGNAHDLDGEVIGWKYDFDDGRRTYGYSDYNYDYRKSGFYTPTFTTTDDDGDKDINKRDTVTGVRYIIVADAIVDNDFSNDGNTPKFGERRFNNIQDAIDSPNVPNEDGLIVVLDGNYNEDIVIDKSIDMISVSEGYSTTHEKITFGGATIDGTADPTSPTTIKITAPNVTIQHLNIIGDEISVETDNDHTTIKDCSISSNIIGVKADTSSNNTIQNCEISDTQNAVILMSNSNDNEINSCIFTQNFKTRYGEAISILNSNANTIKACEIDNHNIGVTIDNSTANRVTHCIINDNNKAMLVKNVEKKDPGSGPEKRSAITSHDSNVITYTNFSYNTYGVHLLNTAYTIIGAENAIFYFNLEGNYEPGITLPISESATTPGYTMKPTPSGDTPQGSPRPKNSYFNNNNYPIFVQNSELNAIKDCIINAPLSDYTSFNIKGPSSTTGVTIQNSEDIMIYRTIVKRAKDYGIHIFNSNNVTIWKSLIWENPVGVLFDHSSNNLLTMSSLINHTICGIYVSEGSYSNLIRYNNIFKFSRQFYIDMINNAQTEVAGWIDWLNNDTRITAYDAGVKTMWDDDGEYYEKTHIWGTANDKKGAGNYWSDYNWQYYITNLLNNGTVVDPNDLPSVEMPEWIMINMTTGETIMPEPEGPQRYDWLEIGDVPYNISGPEGQKNQSQDRYPVFPYPFIWCKEWLNTDVPTQPDILPPEPIPRIYLRPVEL